jgi:hypothetical protein
MDLPDCEPQMYQIMGKRPDDTWAIAQASTPQIAFGVVDDFRSEGYTGVTVRWPERTGGDSSPKDQKMIWPVVVLTAWTAVCIAVGGLSVTVGDRWCNGASYDVTDGGSHALD